MAAECARDTLENLSRDNRGDPGERKHSLLENSDFWGDNRKNFNC